MEAALALGRNFSGLLQSFDEVLDTKQLRPKEDWGQVPESELYIPHVKPTLLLYNPFRIAVGPSPASNAWVLETASKFLKMKSMPWHASGLGFKWLNGPGFGVRKQYKDPFKVAQLMYTDV